MKENNLITDTLLNHIRSGKKPISLVKQLNISPQLLTYHLNSLRSKGMIRKITKGVWEILKDEPKLNSKVKQIRGHAFIWIIKLPNEIKNWDKRQEILSKNNIDFQKKGNTIRILIKGKKVWLNNNSIIIYEPKSFYATLPLETRIKAVNELIETIKQIENTIKINLYGYRFRTKREHYALIDNNVAKEFNKDSDLLILIDNGEWWGVVDKSHNGDELEFFKTKSYSGLVNSNGAVNYYNSHKDTNWKVTPEFTLEALNKLTNAQVQTNIQIQQFNKEINSHLALIKQWKKSNEDWRKSESKKIKDNITNGVQTSLNQW